MSLNRDFSELLSELNARGARYPISFGDTPLFVISESDFVRNKRSVGRAQDLVDAEEIEAILDDRGGLE